MNNWRYIIGAAQVVNYIREGRADLIGLERLNSLIAILPDSEEVICSICNLNSSILLE